jgi:hypothetical protein
MDRRGEYSNLPQDSCRADVVAFFESPFLGMRDSDVRALHVDGASGATSDIYSNRVPVGDWISSPLVRAARNFFMDPSYDLEVGQQQQQQQPSPQQQRQSPSQQQQQQPSQQQQQQPSPLQQQQSPSQQQQRQSHHSSSSSCHRSSSSSSCHRSMLCSSSSS